MAADALKLDAIKSSTPIAAPATALVGNFIPLYFS
jgi:hypothetical protein